MQVNFEPKILADNGIWTIWYRSASAVSLKANFFLTKSYMKYPNGKKRISLVKIKRKYLEGETAYISSFQISTGKSRPSACKDHIEKYSLKYSIKGWITKKINS